MNLLAKKKIEWLLAMSVLFIGCRDEEGLELTPDAQRTKIEYVEFTLPTTNLYFDSLRTDGGSTLLIGEYSDDTFGGVEATGYSEFYYRSGPLPYFYLVPDVNGDDSLVFSYNNINYDTLSFESLTISLRVVEFLTSEAEFSQELEFYELEDSIFSGVIYQADREIPLGESLGTDQATFNSLGYDLSSDTVLADFRLNDLFGQELYDFIANLDPSETDTLTSRKIRFPGIGFVSNGSTGIVEYDLASSLSSMELHMSSKDSTYIIEFQFASSNKFNHIDRDRTGSDFSAIADKRSLDVNDDFVYFNPIAGIMPRIDLSPYLEFAKEMEENDIIIQQAELSIGAEENENNIPFVEITKYYYSNADSSNLSDIIYNVNWSGIAIDPYNTVLQIDNSYLVGGYLGEIISQVDTTTHNFTAYPNVFFQDLLDQVQNEDDLYTDNLVMVSPSYNSLGRSLIYKDSVQLRVFYILPE